MKKIICCALTIAMLACCAGVFAAESIEISECEQNISESCIDVTVSGTADGEILAVIACDKPMDIFSGFAQAAENIVAIAQKATDVTETAVKLFYDENDIEADKIYVYASVDGISITERTIDFYSRTARILMNFKNAASWNEYAGTDGYVNDYKEAFGMFELTDAVSKQLSALSENELNNVYKKMYQERSTFDTVEQIEKAYSDAIVEVYSERGSGTGGSGSGGGGGGGGYPVTGATISTTPDNAGQNQNAVKGFEDLETSKAYLS